MPVLNPQFFEKKFKVEDIDYFVVYGERRNIELPNRLLKVGLNSVLLIKLKEKEVEHDGY